jgi:hypothetical protein
MQTAAPPSQLFCPICLTTPKIGRFTTDDDLRYQEEVHGPVLEQIERGLALLLTKYLTADIRCEGAGRTEELPFPKAALREALLNAVAHKDYSSGSPIQISVYDDRLLFWNDGQRPEACTVATLTRKHPSRPFNPDLANTLFRAGYIEAWGRGTLKMMTECQQYGLPAPRYAFEADGCTVEFFRHSDASLRQQGLRDELRRVVLTAQETGQAICRSPAPPASARRTCSRVHKGFTPRACRELPRRRNSPSSLPPPLSRASAARERVQQDPHAARDDRRCSPQKARAPQENRVSSTDRGCCGTRARASLP